MAQKPPGKQSAQLPIEDDAPTILIVDDEPMTRLRHEIICQDLEPKGKVKILSVGSIPEAIAALEATRVHVVLLDRNVGPDIADPSQNGIASIPDMLRIQPHLQILMITGVNNPNDIVRAIHLGALHYILKETSDAVVLAQIEKALSIAKLALAKLEKKDGVPEQEELLAGSSTAIRTLKRELDRIAVTDSAVLFIGDTGTGKSLAAKAMNLKRAQVLGRADCPFVALNMAAIPDDLAEAELFGSEKGAYTDAVFKRGKLELANNGTLFLDEIGEVSQNIQAKLLTAIETKTFRRLGSETTIRSNFKLACATNRNLPEMVAKKQFREDLYMRISTFTVRCPPLRERKEDIPQIVKAMLPAVCALNHVHAVFEEIPKEFLAFLQEVDLPGNIRGIERCLTWLLVLSAQTFRGRIIFDDWRPLIESKLKEEEAIAVDRPSLPASTITLNLLKSGKYEVMGPGFPGLAPVLDIVAKGITLEALLKHPKRHEAAKALGYSRTHFLGKIRQLGISRKRIAEKRKK